MDNFTKGYKEIRRRVVKRKQGSLVNVETLVTEKYRDSDMYGAYFASRVMTKLIKENLISFNKQVRSSRPAARGRKINEYFRVVSC